MSKDIVPNIDQLIEQETAPSLELEEETRKHFARQAEVQLVTCPVCLNPFAPQREWQLFCCGAHRNRWHSRMKYAAKKKEKREFRL